MKITLSVLLAVSLVLHGRLALDRRDLHKLVALQDEAIKADQDYWAKIQTMPVPVGKHRETGDLYISVPYLTKPLRYKNVCMPELKL